MGFLAKKNFSSGRDKEGRLIQFTEGKEYDLSNINKEKLKLIMKNFTEAPEKATKESIKDVEVVPPADEQVKAEEKPKSKKK